MKNQFISIAMATYNGEQYLKEQLDSIYAQTHKNIEVIVTDDCSRDATVKILEEYAQSHGLKYFVNETNLGFVKNFEKAISLCRGDYIALADQDDIWEKDKLEILLNDIGSNLLIHSDCTIIDGHGKMIQPRWKENAGYLIGINNLLFANVVTGCTLLFKKKLLKTALPFPEGIVYHDWWLAICAARVDMLVYTPKCLTRYRQHIGQDTGAGIDAKKSIVQIAYSNIKNRWLDIDIPRIADSRKQRKNLLALKASGACPKNSRPILNDAIIYTEDYLNNRLHMKTFLLGMKYRKLLYPHKNYLYLKNILMDIAG